MEGEMVSNKQVVLTEFASELLKEENLRVQNSSIGLKLPDESASTPVLVQNLFLSCEAEMAGLIMNILNPAHRYVPGNPIRGFGVSRVIDSGNQDIKPGDFVGGYTGWEEYSIICDPDTNILFDLGQDDQVPPSLYCNLLGKAGFTAYIGLFEIGRAKGEEQVLVSDASGPVGQLVGQFAKLSGCHVVGIAGLKREADRFKFELGFHDVIDSNEEPDLNGALERCFPKGIDVYFDNVGGKMLDAVLLNMRFGGRIVLSEMISEYNFEPSEGIRNLISIVKQQVRLESFTVNNFKHLYPEFLDKVLGHIRKKKIVYLQDITRGLESGPRALMEVFSGERDGGQIVEVVHDSP